MSIKERMSGNEAVAYAIRQVNPDVMPAFPITPSTEIPQMVSTYIANGQMDTEFIPVESEHSSMSAAIGAEAAGATTDAAAAGECKICFDAPINTVLLPCGHLCVCLECSKRLVGSSRVCPICRTKIRKVVRTYAA